MTRMDESLTPPGCHTDLGFLASRMLSNKFLLFYKPPSR